MVDIPTVTGMSTTRSSTEREDGFTLVELAVVLVVLAVLVAVAIPTFLSARRSADDEAAKSAAMNGLKVQRLLYSDGDGYGDLQAARKAEPNLAFDELPDEIDADEPVPAVLGVVYLRHDEDEVVVVSRSKSGRCFWARDREAIAAFDENDCTSSPEFTTSW